MQVSASIDLIIGPMYAGKTTELLRRLNIYSALGVKTLYVNSTVDSRSDLPFSTHNPLLKSIGKCDNVKVENLSHVNYEEYKVIGIDEGQFFNDLKNHVLKYVNKGKKIIISGLNGDYKQKPFGDIINLIPYCDSIDFLTPFCHQCKDRLTSAPFTKRISSEKNTISASGKLSEHTLRTFSIEQISVDSNYIPVCRKHL